MATVLAIEESATKGWSPASRNRDPLFDPPHLRREPIWGATRVHGELLKLGYDVAEATVAIDFFTVPTTTFKTLHVFLVLSLERRRIVHFNVTDSPTAAWTSRQLVQASPFDTAPRFLMRDRDSIYGNKVVETILMLGTEQKIIAYQIPWQTGTASV